MAQLTDKQIPQSHLSTCGREKHYAMLCGWWSYRSVKLWQIYSQCIRKYRLCYNAFRDDSYKLQASM